MCDGLTLVGRRIRSSIESGVLSNTPFELMSLCRERDNLHPPGSTHVFDTNQTWLGTAAGVTVQAEALISYTEQLARDVHESRGERVFSFENLEPVLRLLYKRSEYLPPPRPTRFGPSLGNCGHPCSISRVQICTLCKARVVSAAGFGPVWYGSVFRSCFSPFVRETMFCQRAQNVLT